MLRQPEENKTISQAIQAAIDGTMQESVGYVCLWEQHQAKVDGREPNFGFVVSEVLRVYGIDIRKMRLA